MDLIGKSIGQFQIVERIGQGGMATVFKAFQPALDRHVAIKVLPAQHALTPGFSERFEREAKAIAQLNHPNILPIIDYGQAEGLTYIVMKHVPGGTLAERLRRPLDLVGTVHLVEQIAAALDHAHGRGIIHRDVKPTNVLLDEGDWVQLADFGLAKIVGGDQNLTGTGMGMGTPAYLSPEQGQGLPLDHHADIYSLGVLLYEMVTGQLPFSADNLMAIVFKHIYEPPPAPRSIRAGIPEPVESVLLHGLAKPIAERYASAGDLARALRQAAANSSSDAALRLAGSVDPRATPMLGLRESPVQLATLPHGLLMMETVPGATHFVERNKELAATRARLERERFLIITGMAGVGKTALGAKLARELADQGARVFWFTFDRVEKSTTDALFWALAAFLDSHGDSNLWRYLRGEIDAQKALDRTVRFNLLLSGLASGRYVLCFDDFQIVSGVPEIVYVFELLRQRFVDLRQDIPARIIIMGREVPPELEYLAGGALDGFSREEAETFLSARRLSLPAPLAHQLWERTEGNAKLLELSASALAALGDAPPAVESFFQAMARKGDIRDYLMTNIYASLRPEDRTLMGALSIFPGVVEREAAEHVLAAEGVTGVTPRIDALMNRHLIAEAEGDRLRCHSLVREYGYHALDRKDRERYHQHAADFFEQERNYLSAAHHHFERRAYGRALDLLTAHAASIINAGGAGALLDQLARFGRHVLSPEQRLALGMAQADAHRMRGEYRQLLEACEAALDEAVGDRERAELLHRIGTAYEDLNDYERAIEHFSQSLRLSEAAGARADVADAHHSLGWATYRLGRLEQAREHFLTSQRIGQEASDRLMLAKADLGLGELDIRARRLDDARARFESSRRVFRAVGDRRREAMAVGNLFLVFHEQGETDREIACLREAMTIQEQIGDVRGLGVVLSNLGYSYYLRGRHDQAIDAYRRLTELAGRVGHQRWLSMADSGLADVYLAQGDTQQALSFAQQSVQVARAAGPGRELGIACSVLGHVWLALNDAAQAKAMLEESLPLLEAAQEEEDLDRARRGLDEANARLGVESIR